MAIDDLTKEERLELAQLLRNELGGKNLLSGLQQDSVIQQPQSTSVSLTPQPERLPTNFQANLGGAPDVGFNIRDSFINKSGIQFGLGGRGAIQRGLPDVGSLSQLSLQSPIQQPVSTSVNLPEQSQRMQDLALENMRAEGIPLLEQQPELGLLEAAESTGLGLLTGVAALDLFTDPSTPSRSILGRRMNRFADRPSFKAGNLIGSFTPLALGVNLGRQIIKAPKFALKAFKFLTQAKNRVSHPQAKELFGEIIEADEVWHTVAGQAIEKLRASPLKRNLFRKNVSGERVANAIESGAAPEINAVMDEMHSLLRSVGVDVGYIGREGDRYFPRIFKEDVADRIRDDLRGLTKTLERGDASERALRNALSGKTTDRIIKDMMKKNPNLTYSKALFQLKRKSSEQVFGNLSFLKERTQEMPSWVFERDARKVVPWYINAASKRYAQVRMWGTDFKSALARIDDIAKTDIEGSKTTRKILDVWSGEFEKEFGLRGFVRKAEKAFVGAEFSTKIALGTATIPNITQTFISTMEDFGLGSTLRGAASLLTKGGRKRVRESGALNQSLLSSTIGKAPGGTMGKVVDRLGKLSGFHGINKFNMALAASTAEVGIKSLHKQAQKNTISERCARARLEDFGLKFNETLTAEKLSQKMYRFATNSQLQRNILNDPLIFNDPRFRSFALFKRFGMRQFNYQRELITREISRGNVLPLMRLGAAGYLGGEFVRGAKNEIKELLSGEPQFRRTKPFTTTRLIENLAAVGSFGFVSDISEIDRFSDIYNKLRFTATPVVFADTENIIRAFSAVTRDWEKYGDGWIASKRNINKLLEFGGSLPRFASKRLLTTSQKENRFKKFKGTERTEILDLLIGGNGEEASRRIQLWNQNNPLTPLDTTDINLNEIKKKMKRDLKSIQEANR